MHPDYDKLLTLLNEEQITQGKKLDTKDTEKRRVAQVIVKALSEEYIAIGRMKSALDAQIETDKLQDVEIKDGRTYIDGVLQDNP